MAANVANDVDGSATFVTELRFSHSCEDATCCLCPSLALFYIHRGFAVAAECGEQSERSKAKDKSHGLILVLQVNGGGDAPSQMDLPSVR